MIDRSPFQCCRHRYVAFHSANPVNCHRQAEPDVKRYVMEYHPRKTVDDPQHLLCSGF